VVVSNLIFLNKREDFAEDEDIIDDSVLEHFDDLADDKF
jgi:hypothetical protein